MYDSTGNTRMYPVILTRLGVLASGRLRIAYDTTAANENGKGCCTSAQYSVLYYQYSTLLPGRAGGGSKHMHIAV